jgi:hypothetical protein
MVPLKELAPILRLLLDIDALAKAHPVDIG